jgi:predicted phosphodiesterase
LHSAIRNPKSAISSRILRGEILLLTLCLLGGVPARGAALPFDPRVIRALLEEQARILARRFAPRHYEKPPDWALRSDPPLATIAVLADSHYDDSGKTAWANPTRDRLLKVTTFLNETIKPQAVLILGDIIAFEQADQLRRVKALLDANLRAPCHTIPGNHDGPDYEAVFGPRDSSFAVGGLRFVGIGITYWHWDSGWGTYDQTDWLTRELDAHPKEPTLILIHNPVCMPTFANSGAVLALLDARPQVLAVLAGHMHTDYEMPGAKLHLGMPMLIRPPYAFKVLRVHPDALLLFTYEEHDGAYRQADVYQKIDIPAGIRPVVTRNP